VSKTTDTKERGKKGRGRGVREVEEGEPKEVSIDLAPPAKANVQTTDAHVCQQKAENQFYPVCKALTHMSVG
jgi:hypothetical protein